MTDASQPPGQPSDEASPHQLAFAKQQGDAYGRALEAMTSMDSSAAPQRAGDYLIACAAEEAEGMWLPGDDGLHWRDPQQENAHIEVVVRDAADGRFIPGLKVNVKLADASGKEVFEGELPFLWHPWLFHYGRNLTIPAEGAYTLTVDIPPPAFPRHDRKNGNRFAEPVHVKFSNLKLETGQKISG